MRRILILLGSSVMLLLGVAGCGAAVDSASEPSAPAASPSSPTSSAAPSPVAYGQPAAQATYVRASAEMSLDSGRQTTDADGTVHDRGGKATVRLTGNDPRFTGTEVSTWNVDAWVGSADSDDDVALIQWGKAVLTTADGSWVGSYSGAYTDATKDDLITWWLTGRGAYEGMSLFMWVRQSDAGTATAVYEGLIFPGAPPIAR
jgi:hypothetical protein